VKNALREVMIAAEGAGELTGEGIGEGDAEHPICGDRIRVYCRVVDGVIDDLSWKASGCPATMAVAAASPLALFGVPVDEAPERLHRRLQSLGGLGAHEGHAEKLFLEALTRALGAG